MVNNTKIKAKMDGQSLQILQFAYTHMYYCIIIKLISDKSFPHYVLLNFYAVKK